MLLYPGRDKKNRESTPFPTIICRTTAWLYAMESTHFTTRAWNCCYSHMYNPHWAHFRFNKGPISSGWQKKTSLARWLTNWPWDKWALMPLVTVELLQRCIRRPHSQWTRPWVREKLHVLMIETRMTKTGDSELLLHSAGREPGVLSASMWGSQSRPHTHTHSPTHDLA